MPASYPASIKAFTTKTDGVDDIEASHVNDIQLEVTAIETQLLAALLTVSAVTGWAASPTVTINYYRSGRLVFVNFSITGTSNAVTATMTLTVLNGGILQYFVIEAKDNGGAFAAARATLASGSGLVDFYKDMTGAAFTASGTKTVRGSFCYYAV